jgi:hypothetical protein
MLLFMVLWIIWVLRFLDTEAVTCQTKFLVYNPFGTPSCFMFVWSYSFSSCVWTIILLNGPLHVYHSFIIFKLQWNRNHGMADFMIKHKNQHIIIGESASVMLYKTVMCRDSFSLSLNNDQQTIYSSFLRGGGLGNRCFCIDSFTKQIHQQKPWSQASQSQLCVSFCTLLHHHIQIPRKKCEWFYYYQGSTIKVHIYHR